MKCLHVFPSFNRGGTELRIVRVINGIGPELDHFILSLGGGAEAMGDIDSAVRAELVPRPHATAGVRFMLEFRRLLKRLQPSLLLTYNWGAMDAVIAAAALPSCPLIHNESGFGPDEAASLKLRRVLVRRLVLKRAHATVVNSATLLNIARARFRIPERKLRFIRNGIDLARFHPGRRPDVRERLGARNIDVVFGYIGGFRPEKSVDVAIRAFAAARAPAAHLLLVGDGPTRTACQTLCAELGIAPRVTFTGLADNPVPYLHACDVFVLPSITEQTPNALLEAMGCGLPAVSTDVGDAKELLGMASADLIVRPGDVQGLAAAMLALASDARRRAALGEMNRRRCVDHFSQDRMIREFKALYLEAARARRRPMSHSFF
jgi:glycosyltransferase involved in cell wall biosynthesis